MKIFILILLSLVPVCLYSAERDPYAAIGEKIILDMKQHILNGNEADKKRIPPEVTQQAKELNDLLPELKKTKSGDLFLANFAQRQIQNEAKVILVKIDTLMKAEFSKTKVYRIQKIDFLNNLKNIISSPPDPMQSSYVVGVLPKCSKNNFEGEIKGSNTLEIAPQFYERLAKSEQKKIIEFFKTSKDKCVDNKKGFKFYAATIIDPSRPLDVWVLDELKTLKNTSSGLTEFPKDPELKKVLQNTQFKID